MKWGAVWPKQHLESMLKQSKENSPVSPSQPKIVEARVRKTLATLNSATEAIEKAKNENWWIL